MQIGSVGYEEGKKVGERKREKNRQRKEKDTESVERR